MCVSTAAADFTGTILYGGRRHHPVHGPIEVLGYQNTAHNLADGPNALVLHLAGAVTPEQFIPVGRHTTVLTDMLVGLYARQQAEDDMYWMDGAPQVAVFDHDIYTVVLADDPTRIPAALDRVPPHKRPPFRHELFEYYADTHPGRAVALCCFDNATAERAKPLLLWYRPTDPSRIVLPAVDSHTGGAPDLGSPVERDHWVVFGADDTPEGWGVAQRYDRDIRHKLRAFLPDQVIGREFTGTHPNGDFALALDDLLTGDLDRIEVTGV